jgi:hypothetical protein
MWPLASAEKREDRSIIVDMDAPGLKDGALLALVVVEARSSQPR